MEHVEEEKTRRNAAIQKVQKFSSVWQKLLEEESEKKMTDLYEKLQQTLEAVNTDLSVLEISEEELQKVVSLPKSPHPSFLYLYDLRNPSSKSSGSSLRTPRRTLSREERRIKEVRR